MLKIPHSWRRWLPGDLDDGPESLSALDRALDRFADQQTRRRLANEAGHYLGTVLVCHADGARWQVWPNGHPVVRMPAKRDPIQARILTERVRGVLDDLLGKAAWSPPRDWGRPLVTFPGPGAWEVPPRLWHWDNPCELHLDRPRALFVVSFIGAVAPHSGGTLILSGSPRLLIQQERRIAAGQRPVSIAESRDRFHRSHPWLMALTGWAPSPADRIAAFMDSETIVDGVPLRVVELTGEPGDMVFCHPVMVHCVAPNRGTLPRFMRIKTQVLSHEGRELRSRLAQSAPVESR